MSGHPDRSLEHWLWKVEHPYGGDVEDTNIGTDTSDGGDLDGSNDKDIKEEMVDRPESTSESSLRGQLLGERIEGLRTEDLMLGTGALEEADVETCSDEEEEDVASDWADSTNESSGRGQLLGERTKALSTEAAGHFLGQLLSFTPPFSRASVSTRAKLKDCSCPQSAVLHLMDCSLDGLESKETCNQVADKLRSLLGVTDPGRDLLHSWMDFQIQSLREVYLTEKYRGAQYVGYDGRWLIRRFENAKLQSQILGCEARERGTQLLSEAELASETNDEIRAAAEHTAKTARGTQPLLAAEPPSKMDEEIGAATKSTAEVAYDYH